MTAVLNDVKKLDLSDLSSDRKGGLENNKSLVVCFGEMLIDFVPTVAGVSLAEAPAFLKAPGGAPANVAVGISRLGGSAGFIGKVHFSILLFSSFIYASFFFFPSVLTFSLEFLYLRRIYL